MSVGVVQVARFALSYQVRSGCSASGCFCQNSRRVRNAIILMREVYHAPAQGAIVSMSIFILFGKLDTVTLPNPELRLRGRIRACAAGRLWADHYLTKQRPSGPKTLKTRAQISMASTTQCLTAGSERPSRNDGPSRSYSATTFSGSTFGSSRLKDN